MDLYPSNIFWRKHENAIQIRLIDWDASTFLGDRITSEMQRVLTANGGSVSYKTRGQPDEKSDAWFIYLFTLLTEEERHQVSSALSSESNGHFKNTFKMRLASDQIKSDFEDWFQHNWN